MADLGQDANLDRLRNITGDLTGWYNRLRAMLRETYHSSVNPFGSAYRANTGSVFNGHVPQVNNEGFIDRLSLPNATSAQRGATRIAGSNQRVGTKVLSPGRVRDLQATESMDGVMRRAGRDDVGDADSNDTYIVPVDIAGFGTSGALVRTFDPPLEIVAQQGAERIIGMGRNLAGYLQAMVCLTTNLDDNDMRTAVVRVTDILVSRTIAISDNGLVSMRRIGLNGVGIGGVGPTGSSLARVFAVVVR